MKTHILTLSLLLPVSVPTASAGGRRLFCEGERTYLEMQTKGSIPTGEHIVFEDQDRPLALVKRGEMRDERSYDFQMSYVANAGGARYSVVLSGVAGGHLVTVLKDGEIYEALVCRLGL